MNSARDCMIQQFVPLFLGISCRTIQEVAGRNRVIPEGLFGDSDVPLNEKPAKVICYGTYVYVQSSSNYKFQKDTYSLHKYCNLVKPFLIVCCDGTILECLGPYKATKNDSFILIDALNEQHLRDLFRHNVVFILDRGFRDAIPSLEA